MSVPHAICSHLHANSLVFDVGANIGDKTEWFRSRGCRVVAVEPQPIESDHLMKRFNSCSDVTVIPRALSASKEFAKMHLCNDASTLSTLADHWTTGRFRSMDFSSVLDVETDTLDSLVNAYGIPDYCKIDVEGYEAEVLRGLSKKIGIISFEFTSEFVFKSIECLCMLRSLGYISFNISVGEEPHWALENWNDWESMLSTLVNSCKQRPGLWGDIYAK